MIFTNPFMFNDDKLLETKKLKKEVEDQIQGEIICNFDEFNDLKNKLKKKFAEIDLEIEKKFEELYR